jgi:DNA-directed RNA polymerase
VRAGCSVLLLTATLVGVTFAGVHDSFWTHAARCAASRHARGFLAHAAPRSVDEMSDILRSTVRRSLRAPSLRVPHAPACPVQFVELHSEPLLQQLYESFRRDYPEVVFREPPRPGMLRLEDVRRSPYFFS